MPYVLVCLLIKFWNKISGVSSFRPWNRIKHLKNLFIHDGRLCQLLLEIKKNLSLIKAKKQLLIIITKTIVDNRTRSRTSHEVSWLFDVYWLSNLFFLSIFVFVLLSARFFFMRKTWTCLNGFNFYNLIWTCLIVFNVYN